MAFGWSLTVRFGIGFGRSGVMLLTSALIVRGGYARLKIATDSSNEHARPGRVVFGLSIIIIYKHVAMNCID